MTLIDWRVLIKLKSASAAALSFLALCPVIIGQVQPRDPNVQVKRSAITVKLVDKKTRKPLRNVNVRIYSDNGIRCVKAPCPTNGFSWSGRTDAKGVVRIPGHVRQRSMHISATGYSTEDISPLTGKTAPGVRIAALTRD